MKDGSQIKADGLLAGTPSMVFDAVAIIASKQGCEELLTDGAATDFAKNAFGHLKAIGFSKEAWPLLEKSGVEEDQAVHELKDGLEKFIESARTRLWEREQKVRPLA